MELARTAFRRLQNPHALVAACAFCLGLIGSSVALADEKTAKTTEAKKSDDAPAKALVQKLVARCIDGSLLRIELREAAIPIKTQYGTLNIPVGDVRRIDFSVRIPAEISKQVEAAITKLASEENEVREAARAELLALERMAYPALLKAATSEDTEVSMSAERLLAEIRERVPDEDLQIHELDVVYTENSRFAGVVELESIKIDTVSLGPQALKLNVLHRIVAGEVEEADAANALPDPGSMTRYQAQVGKSFRFRVTGPQPGFQHGTIFGTDFYTLDSSLSMAAVHAGAVKPGQTKIVTVVIMGPQNAFRGSARNGINSQPWNQYPGAFRFKATNAANWAR